MAGVTSRTLRHYDAIGLLEPAHVGANGYRHYEVVDLLRLQQILLLRELGLDLTTIAEVLDGQRDRLAALQAHERWLRAESERLARLAQTVAHTVTHLRGGTTMNASELFDGFRERMGQAEEDLAARFGEGVREHFAAARQRTADWSAEDFLEAEETGRRIDARVLEVMRSGAAPDGDAALDAVDEHFRAVSRHWTPDATSYAGLGRLFVEDPQPRARYDALAPGLAEFYRDAIAAYAARRLG